MNPTIMNRAANVRLLVLDVDGVLTDGRLYFDADGREQKVFHVRDGYGIKALQESGVPVAVISGRSSVAVEKRVAELAIRHSQLGCEDKAAALTSLLAELGIPPDAVACVGDDSPDLPVMEMVGLSIAVGDAHPDVVAAADWVTQLAGGMGAVREICDLLMQAHRPS
jgi:3-deoxy-D-manno-octulosonate 8-phosphate phosphatase (KDO 8-P phosphatase)